MRNYNFTRRSGGPEASSTQAECCRRRLDEGHPGAHLLLRLRTLDCCVKYGTGRGQAHRSTRKKRQSRFKLLKRFSLLPLSAETGRLLLRQRFEPAIKTRGDGFDPGNCSRQFSAIYCWALRDGWVETLISLIKTFCKLNFCGFVNFFWALQSVTTKKQPSSCLVLSN